MNPFLRRTADVQAAATSPHPFPSHHSCPRPLAARALLLGALGLLLALPALAPARALPFTAARDRLTTATKPIYQFITADINRDGWPDLVVREVTAQSASGNSSRIVLALHTGATPPAYQQIVIHEENNVLLSHAVADLDGDGDLDILLHSRVPSPHALVWFENANGDGSVWTPRGNIAVFANNIQRIRTGDFDQDGDLDIVVNSSIQAGNNNWGWMENTAGDGSAWEFRALEAGPVRSFDTIDVGDIDLNGALDILVYSSSSNTHRIYWNNGAAPPVFTMQSLSIPHGFGGLTLADVWGDRRLEFFRMDDNNTIWWYRFTGSAWEYDQVDMDNKGFYGLIDLDRNGSLDVLAIDVNDNPTWYENSTFHADLSDEWTKRQVNGTTLGSYASPADIDRDGDLDWLYAYNVVNRMGVHWFENLDPHKKAGFLPPIDINTAANGVRDVVAVHLNADRYLDVAGVFADGDNAQFNLGEGPDDWSFASGRLIGSGAPLDGAAALDAGRVDRDGQIDLVTAASESGQIRYWQNMGVENPTPFLGYLVDTLEGAKDVALGDFDRDGDLDIAAVGRTCTTDVIPICTGSLVWYEQSANPTTQGAWTRHLIQDTRTDYTVVAVADLDGDGDLDIVTAYRNVTNPPVQLTSNAIQWFENDGESPPAFTARTISSTMGGSSVQALRVVDMDGDADLDVLTVDFTGNAVRWFENTMGDASAWTAHLIADGFDAVRAVDAADVDQDGDMDVLVASYNDNRLIVLENNAGMWDVLFEFDQLNGPQAARFVDLNNDGAHDILAGFDNSDVIVWFPGTVGSFTLSCVDIAPAVAGEGSETPALRAELSNWARPGEKAIIPNTITMIVKNQSGDILNGAQIKTILSHVALYADSNGDGVLDVDDALVIKIPSTLLPNEAPGVLLDLNANTAMQLALVPPGEARNFFGVVGIQPGAAATPITHFSIEIVDVDDEEAVEYPLGPGKLREHVGVREATQLIAIQDVIFSLDGWLLR